MSGPPNEKLMARLLIGLTEGMLSDPQRRELRDLVQGDDACRADYIDHMMMHAMLEFRHGWSEAQPESPETESLFLESFHAQIQFAEAADEGFPEPFTFESRSQQRNSQHGARHTFSLLGYVASKAVRKHAVTLSGIAAVLMLAAILVFVFKGMGDDSAVREVVSDDPPVVDLPADPQAMQVVATLTAESDALWDRRPGEDLFAGQQFVLTQGYAEIATASGTDIILEAPSVIEFTDSENMIVLHMGKLVGICEVPSSKGFVVRTPNLDVEDLGTRFGVKVSEQGDSEVHVLEGSVLLTSNSEPQTLQTLTVGQAVEVGASRQITELQIEPKQFTTLIGHHRGQPRVAGSKTVWLDEVPPDLRLGGSESDMLQIIREQENFTLTQDINVNLIPGELFTRPLPREAKQLDQIKAGQRVSVYLLHLDPERKIQDATYTIHFDQPILGVIVLDKELNQTDATLGRAEVRYPRTDKDTPRKSLRGLDDNNPLHDILICKEYSLDVKLGCSAFIDQIRVIVVEP